MPTITHISLCIRCGKLLKNGAIHRIYTGEWICDPHDVVEWKGVIKAGFEDVFGSLQLPDTKLLVQDINNPKGDTSSINK